MARFPDLESITDHLDELITREEGALVMILPPGPGQKERRYAHLLAGEPSQAQIEAGQGRATSAPANHALEERVVALEAEVQSLRQALDDLRASLGVTSADEDAGVADV